MDTDQGSFFLKWNDESLGNLFETEAKGLEVLSNTREISVPKVEFVGKCEDKNFILMEYINSAPPAKKFWEDFGQKLANLHKNHCNHHFGLDHNNFIGSLPQDNNFQDDWINFFIEFRLEFQLKLALNNSLVDEGFAKRYRSFYQRLPDLLPEEPASLLHGDLWSGNFLTGSDGLACLIDPAIYFGNREIELSFTKMFGGFDINFYQAYHETFPLAPGFETRVDIYNMYPSMVHVNLFGTSYLSGVERVLRKYN